MTSPGAYECATEIKEIRRASPNVKGETLIEIAQSEGRNGIFRTPFRALQEHAAQIRERLHDLTDETLLKIARSEGGAETLKALSQHATEIHMVRQVLHDAQIMWLLNVARKRGAEALQALREHAPEILEIVSKHAVRIKQEFPHFTTGDLIRFISESTSEITTEGLIATIRAKTSSSSYIS